MWNRDGKNYGTSWGWAVPSSSSCEFVFLWVRHPVRLSSCKVIFLWARLPESSSPSKVVFFSLINFDYLLAVGGWEIKIKAYLSPAGAGFWLSLAKLLMFELKKNTCFWNKQKMYFRTNLFKTNLGCFELKKKKLLLNEFEIWTKICLL